VDEVQINVKEFDRFIIQVYLDISSDSNEQEDANDVENCLGKAKGQTTY